MDEWHDILPRMRNKQLVWYSQCSLFLNWISERYIQQAQWKRKGLIKCAEKGDLPGVRYLVERCVDDAHALDEEALVWASENGHLEVVRFLVEMCGADVHAEDERALRF
jgi:hypothetical protein